VLDDFELLEEDDDDEACWERRAHSIMNWSSSTGVIELVSGFVAASSVDFVSFVARKKRPFWVRAWKLPLRMVRMWVLRRSPRGVWLKK
jgi:hypothetical protein